MVEGFAWDGVMVLGDMYWLYFLDGMSVVETVCSCAVDHRPRNL